MNERLRNCSRFVHTLFPGTADLLIGDLSRPGGGRFPPHESHQSGRDADAGYYLAGNIQNSTLHRVGVAGLDPAKTWMYMRCLIAPGDVVRMYVDRALQRGLVAYLERIGAESPESLARLFEVVGGASALIRHAPYHDTHLHVRFACPGGAAGAGAERPEGAVAGTTEVPSGPSSGSAPGSSGPAPDPLSPQAPGEVQGTEPCALEPGEAPFQP
jgi:hypothetical protein